MKHHKEDFFYRTVKMTGHFISLVYALSFQESEKMMFPSQFFQVIFS